MLSGFVTVLTFAAFAAIVWWAWHRDNQDRFAAAARLPLEDDGRDSASGAPS